MHEFWANIILIAIATWLLSTHIGYAAAGPIFVAFVALIATVVVTPLGKSSRVRWLEITQRRISVTSALIGNIKSIKASGLSERLFGIIIGLRIAEIAASRPFRIFDAISSSIAQIPLLLSPVAAFALFQAVSAQTGQVLDATRMFAALSLVILLAQPLFWMFEVVLDMAAAFAAFERIEIFLFQAERNEYRELVSGESTDNRTFDRLNDDQSQSLIGSAALPPRVALPRGVDILVDQANFAWNSEHKVLQDISFTLKSGSMTMLVGKVASGKTTLLKGLLGEVSYTTGTVSITDTSLSWCDQSPWICVSLLVPWAFSANT